MIDTLRLHVFKLLAACAGVLIIGELCLGVLDVFKLDKAAVVPSGLPVEPPKQQIDIAHVKAVEYPAFGVFVPAKLDGSGIAQSSLKASVVGVLFSADEKKSHVLLELSGHKVRGFGVGDRLPGGAIVKRISSDGVLILRNGLVESLTLPKNELTFAPEARPLPTVVD